MSRTKQRSDKPRVSDNGEGGSSGRKTKGRKKAVAASSPQPPPLPASTLTAPNSAGGPSLLVLIIDGQNHARRDAVLRAAFDAIRSRDSRDIYRDVQINSFPPSEQLEIKESLRAAAQKHIPTLTLVVVSERDRSKPADGITGRLPCDSISLGYGLIDEAGVANDIYYVVNDITAVETLSLLLSGARGVIQVDALGAVGLLMALVDGTTERDKRLNRKLAGRPYHELELAIDVWRRNLQIADRHWLLVLALAEIPVMRLPTQRTRDIAEASSIEEKRKARKQPTQKQIALEISLYSSVTGFSYSGSERLLPDVLKMLEVAIMQIETGEQASYEPSSVEKRRRLAQEEMFELPFLPVYARRAGFPSRLLPIRGINDTQLSDHLYAGISRVEIKRTRSADALVIADVTVPRDLSR